MARADDAAQSVLAEYNASLPESTVDGRLSLRHYLRAVSKRRDPTDGRPILMIVYELKKLVAFKKVEAFAGHPQHFSIWVYRDTGETRVFGGE